MIDASVFQTEPWLVREASLDLDVLAQSESVFALGNGHLGLRGNLDEGEPYGLPGTYLNGVYELRPLPYAEAGYGYPESGQTMINVTNGKVLRLLVDDEPFDVRYGTLHHHERILDFRSRDAPADGRMGLAGRPGHAGHVGAAGVVHPAGGGGHRVRGGGRRGPGPDRRPVGAGGQRADAPARQRSPGGGGAQVAAGQRGPRHPRATAASSWCTAPSTAACGWRRPWTTSSTGPNAPTC